MFSMPPKSRLKLPPLNLGKETIGQRLGRLRKERGLSQIALAEKMGIIQQLITDYERDLLRMHAEMVIRFAKALDVSTDSLLLGEKMSFKNKTNVSLKVAKRLQRIEELPEAQQRTVLRSLDMLLDGVGQRAD